MATFMGHDYIPRIPRTVPPGKVLVHSHVRTAMRQGRRGFRFWLAAPAARYVPCACGWAPHLEHFRVEAKPRIGRPPRPDNPARVMVVLPGAIRLWLRAQSKREGRAQGDIVASALELYRTWGKK